MTMKAYVVVDVLWRLFVFHIYSLRTLSPFLKLLNSVMFLPFIPLSCTLLLSPTPLPSNPTIPPRRLNLLYVSDSALYLVASPPQVLRFPLLQPNHVLPPTSIPIPSCTSINNLLATPKQLILALGLEFPPNPAALLLIPLPSGPSQLHNLPFVSAWALSSHKENIAVGCNSRVVAELSSEGTLRTIHQHGGNVPTVDYETAHVIASGSLDGIVRVTWSDAKGSTRVNHGTWSSRVRAADACWLVKWVKNPIQVNRGDVVWEQLDTQIGSGIGKESYGGEGTRRSTLFSTKGKWAHGAILDDNHLTNNRMETESGKIIRGKKEKEGKGCEGLDLRFGDLVSHDIAINQYKLLLVGRSAHLELYRVRKEGTNVELMLVDTCDLYVDTGLSFEKGWCVKAELIGRLNAVAIAITGIGVVVIRVLQKEEGTERIFVERVLTRDQVGEKMIAGLSVVEKGDEVEGNYSVEIWVVWLDGTVQSWELWRRGALVDGGVHV